MATIPEESLRARDPDFLDEINQYIDELKDEAQGDYDFVVKFLKQQFSSALGTDDGARKKFFSDVANQLEKRIGRIPFDYDLKTGREKEDFKNFIAKKDMEDAEQRKEEIEFGKQQALATTKEQKGIKEGANVRGMLGSGIEKRQSQEARTERATNIIDPQSRIFAYDQALRNEQRRLGKVSSDRNIMDIKTGARRAGEDEQFNLNYGTEKAQKTLGERLADLRRLRDEKIGEAEQFNLGSSLENFL